MIDERAQSLATKERLRRDRHGKVPRVIDIDDPIEIGVHPAAPDLEGRRLPPFVVRERSAEIEDGLRKHSFVLIVGESTAGKSRAAFEAARSVCPHHALIVPDPTDRGSLRAALAAAQRARHAVVWLDDIKRYLGTDAMTAHMLQRMTRPRAGRELVVLATIRAQERARYRGLDRVEDQRVGRDVLALAHEIRLERRWTTDEVERARTFDADRRVGRAIDQAHQFGIAESLAAGPQLLAAWQDAWAPEGGHVRGAALVTAAVESRRAGWQRPLPVTVLRDLHEGHLAARGGAMLHPESWEEAVAWATTPLCATSSPLIPTGTGDDAYLVFDYLPDAIDSDPIRDDTWPRLIGIADPETCSDIGWVAYDRRKHDVAAEAFQKALDGGVVMAAVGSARVLGDALRYDKARRVLLSALATTSRSDPTAPLLLSALSWWTGLAQNTDGALLLAQEAWNALRREHGDDHRASIQAGRSVARWLGKTGDRTAALELARKLQARAHSRYGPDAPATSNCRFEVAIWTWDSDHPAPAIRLWRELLRDARRTEGRYSVLANDTLWNLAAALLDAGEPNEGLELMAEVVDGRATMFGDDHPWTLAGRLQHVGWTGESGHITVALALAADTTATAALALGHDHELVLAGRHQQALWTALSGETDRAITLFSELLAACESALPPGHVLVEQCRAQLSSPGQRVWYLQP